MFAMSPDLRKGHGEMSLFPVSDVTVSDYPEMGGRLESAGRSYARSGIARCGPCRAAIFGRTGRDSPRHPHYVRATNSPAGSTRRCAIVAVLQSTNKAWI